MRKITYFMVLVASLFVLSIVGYAQEDDDEEHPLLAMMALVPNIPSVTTSSLPMSYVNYRAVEVARLALRPFTSHEAWLDARGSLPFQLWLAASMRLNGGDVRLLQNLLMADEMPEVVGFDFFDIEASVSYGQPPEFGILYFGEFDLEAVRSAHEARGYTQKAFGDAEVWCAEDGCEAGNIVNVANRNQSNPFGGDLGRQQPVMLMENVLFSTPALANIQGQAALISGRLSSLADLPAYRTLAEALISQGEVLQVEFILPKALQPWRQAEDSGDNIPLPAYELVAFGDLMREDGEAELTVIAMVYEDVDQATEAGEAMIARFEAGISIRNQTLDEAFADRGLSIGEPIIYEGDDKVVMLLTLSRQAPTSERNNNGDFVGSGEGYRLLYSMLITADIAWFETP